MSEAVNTQLLIAIAIVVVALGGFSWVVISHTRRVGLLFSESRVPRRYLLLGAAAAFAAIYVKWRLGHG